MTIPKRDQAVIIGEGLYAARDEGRAEGREAAAMVCDELAEEAQAAYRRIREKEPILGIFQLDELTQLHAAFRHAASKIRGED